MIDVATPTTIKARAHAAIWAGKGPTQWSCIDPEVWDHNEKGLLAVLVEHLHLGLTGLRQDYLAEKAGVCARTVIRKLKVLERAGVVTCQRGRTRGDRGAQEVNVYTLHIEALEGWVGQSRPAEWDPPTRQVDDSQLPNPGHLDAAREACRMAGLLDHEAAEELKAAARADLEALRAARADETIAARTAANDRRKQKVLELAEKSRAGITAKAAQKSAGALPPEVGDTVSDASVREGRGPAAGAPPPERLPGVAVPVSHSPKFERGPSRQPFHDGAASAPKPRAPAEAVPSTTADVIAAVEQWARESPADEILRMLARAVRRKEFAVKLAAAYVTGGRKLSVNQEATLRTMDKELDALDAREINHAAGPGVRAVAAPELGDEHHAVAARVRLP